ncbi:sulfite exporter TauE/SafE family protein [Rhodovibrio salinarum]|uniref:Probable membrane transporter protein n=1 Tax=Rhodovibrio salinarum TaxID=1087 RepID=A0A934V052_9PROT|nr:sulfite exporter TauE/SafE family protein [Rhodovibrio salinarum]MBK1697060.1 sulfite exporter TauE/SafE family protein [Rhodovibrio salinarum]
MQIYLPIAELSLDVFLLLGLGGVIGFLSGLFGVGGGFLMTPLLIFIGVPPPVAVATQANNVVASSISGVLAHFRRGNVDVKMGTVLLVGGLAGSTSGVSVFKLLSDIGQIDLVINLSYVFVLGTVGVLMTWEGIRAFRRTSRKMPARKLHQHNWAHGLPFKMRFHRSRLYMSALLPLGIGFGVGVLSAIMGVGGGFVLVPAMIYLLGMPTSIVIGTSLFQIIFVAANVTFLQAMQNQTVDIVLALMLLLGGVVGAQYGSRLGSRLPGEALRILLGVLVIGVALRLLYELVSVPVDIYSIGIGA